MVMNVWELLIIGLSIKVEFMSVIVVPTVYSSSTYNVIS